MEISLPRGQNFTKYFCTFFCPLFRVGGGGGGVVCYGSWVLAPVEVGGREVVDCAGVNTDDLGSWKYPRMDKQWSRLWK